MVGTKRFRQQHRDIMELAEQLASLLDADGLEQDPKEASRLLTKLSTKVKMHLKMEDSSLYPRIMREGNEEAQEIARQFQEEMGGIADTFTKYVETWNTPSAIGADASGFVRETKTILEVLGDRVEKEDTVLYETADKVMA